MEKHDEEFTNAWNALPEQDRKMFDLLVSEFVLSIEDTEGPVEFPYEALACLIANGWEKKDRELPPPTASEEEKVYLIGTNISASGVDELIYDTEDPWLVVSRQYFKACTVFCKHILRGDTMVGNLIMPVLFCFRHFMELYMKCILETIRTNQDNTLNLYTGHSVDHLKNMLKQSMPADMNEYMVIFNDVNNKKAIASVKGDIALILTWVRKLNKVDTKSDRFRYPVSKSEGRYEFPRLEDTIGITDVQSLIDTLNKLDAAFQRVGYFFEQYSPQELSGS